MRPYPHENETTPPSLRGIGEGLTYALRRRDLLGTYLIDITAMLLAMPVVLFPALAEDVFAPAGAARPALHRRDRRQHARDRHLGLDVARAPPRPGDRDRPRWPTARRSVSRAWRPTIWGTMLCLVLAGAADMVSGLFRATIWNQTIPDSMRGRLAGIEMLSYSLGPLGGQVRAGVVADLWTVRGSIASGGALCVAGVAATALWLRDFWSYDTRTDEHAVRERSLRQALDPA